jgi:hypothetical protein
LAHLAGYLALIQLASHLKRRRIVGLSFVFARFRASGRALWFVKTRTFFSGPLYPVLRVERGRRLDARPSEATNERGGAIQGRRDKRNRFRWGWHTFEGAVNTMVLSFPAMRGHMGKRDYFVTMVKLSLVPKLFKFRDWAELPPEQRAQRVIQKSRIPEITQYILENEDGYLFSSLTASFDCEPKFTPAEGRNDIGVLEILFDADLVINDGQHRRAAIEEALRENPKLGDETISVVLFPFEDLARMQQMFSDLNRTARTTSKSLNILYNQRDLMSQITLAVTERIDAFKGIRRQGPGIPCALLAQTFHAGRDLRCGQCATRIRR